MNPTTNTLYAIYDDGDGFVASKWENGEDAQELADLINTPGSGYTYTGKARVAKYVLEEEPLDAGDWCAVAGSGSSETRPQVGDTVEFVRDGLWPGVSKGHRARVLGATPLEVHLDIPGVGDCFVTARHNVRVVDDGWLTALLTPEEQKAIDDIEKEDDLVPWDAIDKASSSVESFSDGLNDLYNLLQEVARGVKAKSEKVAPVVVASHGVSIKLADREQVQKLAEIEQAVRAEAELQPKDWTLGEDGCNTSPAFCALVDEVERLIRGDAHKLLNGQANATARLIMAQLAHKHGLRLAPPKSAYDV